MMPGLRRRRLPRPASRQLHVMGSYLEFDNSATLRAGDPPPEHARGGRLDRRTTTSSTSSARLTRGGQVPLQLVADYCWNTAEDDEQPGPLAGRGAGRDRERHAASARLHLRQGGQGRHARRLRRRRLLLGHGLEGPPRRPRLQPPRKNSDPRRSASGSASRTRPDPDERDHWVKRYRSSGGASWVRASRSRAAVNPARRSPLREAHLGWRAYLAATVDLAFACGRSASSSS